MLTLTLRGDHIELFTNFTITVRKGKGGYYRVVPIVERTVDAINDYLVKVRPLLATLPVVMRSSWVKQVNVF